jgi:hypothetical protein
MFMMQMLQQEEQGAPIEDVHDANAAAIGESHCT